MKYKVGDKVKIRVDLIPFTDYDGVHFAYDMIDYRGQILTIKGIYGYQGIDAYSVEECGWSFSDGMIEGLMVKYKKEDKDIMKDFKIKNYNVCDNDGVKTVVVEFEDGSREHAVCNKDDIFELERGIEVCVLKHLLGADKYKASIKEANRQIKAIDREAARVKKAEEESKEITKRRRAKAAKRKERQRERRIAEMKEAYVAALRECGLDIESHNDCDCGGKCDCGGWDILK